MSAFSPSCFLLRPRPPLFDPAAISAALLTKASSTRLIVAAIVLLAMAPRGMAQSEARTWTDATGKYTVRASIERIDGESIWLKKEDGQVIQVAIKVLSPSDQAAVATLRGKSVGSDSKTAAKPAVEELMIPSLRNLPSIVAYRLRQGAPSSQHAIEVMQSIQPNSWQIQGGPGVVLASGNFLFVRQSAAVHRQISSDSSELWVAVTPPASPSRLLPPNIREATADVRFDGVSLRIAVEHLSEATGIPIVIGEGLTESDSPAANRSITLGLQGAKLTTLLDFLASTLDITWRVEKGQVTLLTHAADNNDPPSFPWRLSAADRRNAMPLIHLIQSLVAPASWRDAGGRGSIRLETASGRLAITNNFSALRQVEQFLLERESLLRSR